MLEVAMEEAHGKLPIIAGTWAMTTEEQVETAKDARRSASTASSSRRRAERRTSPPAGMPTTILKSGSTRLSRKTGSSDLPIVTHPVGGAKPPFHPGLPLEATLRICREVENIVGWKMTYMYDGFRIIAKDCAASIGMSP